MKTWRITYGSTVKDVRADYFRYEGYSVCFYHDAPKWWNIKKNLILVWNQGFCTIELVE